MMYDDDFLYSYSQRAKENYDVMKNTEYGFTMLLCSFVGVVAIIDDNAREELFCDQDIPNFITMIKCDICEKDNNSKVLAFYRHLRNSLCHLKIDNDRIKSNNESTISSIILKDYWEHEKKGKKVKDKTFECTLTIETLEKLFYVVVDVIQKKLAKKEE